jgi:hypothetical protein
MFINTFEPLLRLTVLRVKPGIGVMSIPGTGGGLLAFPGMSI